MFAQKRGAPDSFLVKATVPPIPSIAKLPDTDDGIPGAGPIRRYDWFRSLWRQKRIAWSKRVEQDKGAVVFLGDSITQGWGDTMGNSFPGMKVANRGISGDTTRGVLLRLKEDVLDLQPKGVVLLIGTNDIEENADAETIAGNVKLILAALKKHNPAMPVIVSKVMPSDPSKKRPKEIISKLNSLVDEIVKAEPTFIRCDAWSLFANADGNAKKEEFPDLLHPNKAGYAKYAEALTPLLKQTKLLP
jgi:lysophospholipase L1-like esterase